MLLRKPITNGLEAREKQRQIDGARMARATARNHSHLHYRICVIIPF